MATAVTEPMLANFGALAVSEVSPPAPLPSQRAADVDSEIRLLLAVQRQDLAAAKFSYEAIQAFPGDTIRDIKLRLRNRGWFTSRHCLIFGNKELLEHETVAEVMRQSAVGGDNSAGQYLHIFVRLADVEGVSLQTLGRQGGMAFSSTAGEAGGFEYAACNGTGFGSPGFGSRSTRSAGVSGLTRGLLEAPRSLSELEEGAKAQSPPDDASSGDSVLALRPVGGHPAGTVIHLMVRKSAKVNWRHAGDDRFELSISCSDTVDELKRKLAAANPELGDHEVCYDGQVLRSGAPLSDYGITKGSLLTLTPVEPPASRSVGAFPDGSPLLSSPAHQLYDNWQKARAGLAGGQSPQLATAGTGGSYFLQDTSGRNVAVFKPEDEEPHAVNNPKGLSVSPSGEGLRKGTRPGEGAVREVAAYLLDHDHFSGVPPTALVRCHVGDGTGDAAVAADGSLGSGSSSPGSDGAPGQRPIPNARKSGGGLPAQAKVGSLQQFVQAEGDLEERGTSGLPVAEVHKICVLDIRLANTDRNGGNILVHRNGGSWRLTPIDHGYCLPASFEDLAFEWLYWPQAKVPFDAATLSYIASLNAERDIAILEAHDIRLRPECLRVLRVSTALLQRGAALGLSPYQIGCIMTRQAFTKSPLEKLHTAALRRAATEMAGGRPAVGPPGGIAARAAAVRAGTPAGSAFDALYLRHMLALLDDFLGEFAVEHSDYDADILF